MPNLTRSKPRLTKQLIWLLPLIAFLALVLLMKVSGNGQRSNPPVEAKIHLAQVASAKWQQSYQPKRLVSGQVEAPQTADVGFELAGSVKTLLVDEGDLVKQGQVLAQLDTQSLLAQVNELTAMQKRAKAEANLAALLHKRVVELVKQKLEPAQRLDESEQSLNMTNAYVEELSARKQRLQIELAKTQVLAPFDGSVVRRLLDHGSVVSAGQTVFKLQQDGKLQVRFAMPTDYAQSFSIGKSISLNAAKQRFNGQIKSISGLRRLDTRTVDMIVNITDQAVSIVPGDILNIELKSTIEALGIWIPRQALVTGVRGLWSLFVAEPIDGGHKLTAKLVEIIHADQSKAYVSGALLDGDLIVINGVQRLVPGQKVQLHTSRAE